MRLLALPAFEDNYIWALVDDEGDALVIDPGDAAPVLAATGNGLWPAAVLVTHHHPDHAGGIAALRARWPTLPVFAPRDDRIPEASDRVGEGDVVQVKHWRLSVLEVPGHTRSHIAFHGGSPGTAPHLFCGDTLFSLGCGRLFEGTPAQMLASLRRPSAQQLADSGVRQEPTVVETVPEFVESAELDATDAVVLALPGGAVQAVLHGEITPMDGLRQLDSVAYIRFASVYRDFGEAKDFEDFASAVQDMSGRDAGKS